MNKKKLTLAVIPTDPLEFYLASGYTDPWLRSYFNPCGFFDKVYILSSREKSNSNLLGFESIYTEPAELKQRLKDLNVDMVRAYGGHWACAMACDFKAEDIPVMVSVHDMDPELLCDSIKRADFVLCVSEAVRNFVLTKFKYPERVWVLPNRVNFDVMRPYSKESCGDLSAKYPFKFKIVHVGRKRPQKNLDNLIKALKILGPDYCLLASGKGDTEFYAQIAKSEGVSDRCFLIDAISNDELARYYSWADCMCNPSRHEGFGIVFIEALACGAAVVTSDIAPMNEYITNLENGILVKDYENPEALAKAVSAACNDVKIREKIKTNARSSVGRFEKSKVDQLEADYYRKALEMGPNHRSFFEKLPDFVYYRMLETKNRIFKKEVLK